MRRFAFVASLACVACLAAPIGAAVLDVDTVVDDGALSRCTDAVGDCSLRGALLRANALAEAVTINLPAGTYVLSQATGCAFRGTALGVSWQTPALCPVGNVTIAGAGSGATVIDAAQPAGSISVRAPVTIVATTGRVTVRGVTLRRGNFSGSSFEGHGGGINNAGVLVLEDSVVTENWSSSSGGGIYNQGELTLTRSVVSRNFSGQSGGGIVNTNLVGSCPTSPCHNGEGLLRVRDSVISENFAELGGGIYNYVGTADLVSSTVSGNRANGSGGGIYNSAWHVKLTNVTVSGNRAPTGGGIVNSGATYSTMDLVNVTVTANTAQWESDPNSGIGGGLTNGDNGVVTIANTIIAGNFAAGNCGLNGCAPPGTDCFAFAPRNAGVTSRGYNLIGTAAACDIVGDATGNLTNVDARLSVLAFSGGVTPTHMPTASSPAIDAASPALPGSGTPACALADQRGFLRPIGSRCDIGAAERSGEFALAGVVPRSGGNAGQVSVQVGGSGMVSGARVALRRSGRPDILGTGVGVDDSGSTAAATFDLTGQLLGAWDIAVTNPDGTSRVLPGAFAVQAGKGPKLWVDVIGIIKRRTESTVTVLYGNQGDADARGVPLTLSVPAGHQFQRLFAVTAPPSRAGQSRPDWAQVPVVAGGPPSARFLQMPLLLPLVPAGYSGILRVALTMPVAAVDTFMLASIGDPVFAAGPSSGYVAQAVTGARGLLTQQFGLATPAALVPELIQYAAQQLTDVVTAGSGAYAASLGSAPAVYSIGQLQLDLALYTAQRIGGTVP